MRFSVRKNSYRKFVIITLNLIAAIIIQTVNIAIITMIFAMEKDDTVSDVGVELPPSIELKRIRFILVGNSCNKYLSNCQSKIVFCFDNLNRFQHESFRSFESLFSIIICIVCIFILKRLAKIRSCWRRIQIHSRIEIIALRPSTCQSAVPGSW